MIPATAHFVWFGQEFPWAYALSIRSAATHGGFERVVLHADSDLSSTPWWDWLAATPNFEVRRLDAESTLLATGSDGPKLLALFESLSQPAAKSNMIRAALLDAEGGVYLDTDTITIKSLAPLRESASGFCGLERIVFPHSTVRSRAPWIWAMAGVKLGLRDIFRRLPGGWRSFRRIERYYAMAANNAVLAAEPNHPFIRELLNRMIQMNPQRQQVRFALGTHLLQETLAQSDHRHTMEQHAPSAFYPLGPEISQHWFRPTTFSELDLVLRPATRVVHWYASVGTKNFISQMTPEAIGDSRFSCLLSQLARRVLDGHEESPPASQIGSHQRSRDQRSSSVKSAHRESHVHARR